MVFEDVENEVPPLVQSPPLTVDEIHSTHSSMETLVVVLAVITIIGVIAGIIARLCGARHFGGSGDDTEGWVDRKCRSCIDGGVPTAPPPPLPPPKEEPNSAPVPTPTAAEVEKK